MMATKKVVKNRGPIAVGRGLIQAGVGTAAKSSLQQQKYPLH